MVSEWGERVVALWVRITAYVKRLTVSVLEKYLAVAASFLLWVSVGMLACKTRGFHSYCMMFVQVKSKSPTHK